MSFETESQVYASRSRLHERTLFLPSPLSSEELFDREWESLMWFLEANFACKAWSALLESGSKVILPGWIAVQAWQ